MQSHWFHSISSQLHFFSGIFQEKYFKYGVLKSKRIEEEQIYLLFKGRENLKLDLVIDPKEKLDYKINLKHIMIIDISNMNLQKEDIPYLPFI